METSVKVSTSLLFSILAFFGALACFAIWTTTTKASMHESTSFYTQEDQSINQDIRDKTFPVLTVENQRIALGDSFSKMEIVSVTDAYDNLNSKIDVYGEVNTQEKGEYVLHYVVRNRYGLKSEKKIKVIVD